MPGGLLRHVDTGALCHRLYPPPVCGSQFFLHLPTTSRASWPSCCQPAPPVCTSCVWRGCLLSLMPERRPRRRAGPTAPGLPAGVGQRARRRAKLVPPFAGRAGPRQKGLPVITRRIFANRRWRLAPFLPAAFSGLEIAEQGPGMASLRCAGKWPGALAVASGREAARRPRGDPEPGRDRAERLVAGTWRRTRLYWPGTQRRKARAQPGQAGRWPPPPGPGRRRPWPHAPRLPKTRLRIVITHITERATKVPESGARRSAGTLSRGYLAAITPLICDVRSP